MTVRPPPAIAELERQNEILRLEIEELRRVGGDVTPPAYSSDGQGGT